jgi:hypothetical protein
MLKGCICACAHVAREFLRKSVEGSKLRMSDFAIQFMPNN